VRPASCDTAPHQPYQVANYRFSNSPLVRRARTRVIVARGGSRPWSPREEVPPPPRRRRNSNRWCVSPVFTPRASLGVNPRDWAHGGLIVESRSARLVRSEVFRGEHRLRVSSGDRRRGTGSRVSTPHRQDGSSARFDAHNRSTRRVHPACRWKKKQNRFFFFLHRSDRDT